MFAAVASKIELHFMDKGESSDTESTITNLVKNGLNVKTVCYETNVFGQLDHHQV